MKSRCFWGNYKRDWFFSFLLDTQVINVSLPPLKAPLDVWLGWHQRNVSQRRDANHCQVGQAEATSNSPSVFLLIPPFWSNHGSCRFDEESQDGKHLGLWLYSWWTPPWNICNLEINHIVLSHWYGEGSLFAAAIINLTKRFIPPFPYPFPLLCHLRVWVQEHLDLKNSEQPRPCHQHFQVLTLMSDTCHIGIAWKEITS